MAAPAEVSRQRWDQAVRAVARAAAVSDAEADAWLEQVWNGMFSGNEVVGREDLATRLREWLVAQSPNSPTLPRAFRSWAVA